MGILVNSKTGERILLRGNHVFGRNALRSDTSLSDPEVSLMHAVIRWRDGHWFITDHSRNGSFLDGRALARGEAVVLSLGKLLRFGSDAGSTWRMADVSAPGSSLLPVDPTREPIRLAHHNLLPNSAAPECSVYEASRGHWMLEQQGELHPLADGDTIDLSGALYQIFIADDMDDTRASVSLPEPPMLNFRLSLDEEHTWLEVHCGLHHADLGERSHHYPLVTLARKRLADAEAHIDPAAQGWLGSAELARMLGLELTHLNIQIYRARDQLMNTLPGVPALAQMVERRRGGLRLGAVAFEIHRGSQLEGYLRPQTQEHAQ